MEAIKSLNRVTKSSSKVKIEGLKLAIVIVKENYVESLDSGCSYKNKCGHQESRDTYEV